MAKTLSYADAVKILGGAGPFVKGLDSLANGILLMGGGVGPTLLGLFDAKDEVVGLCHRLLRSLSERRNGLSRYDRTQRLVAAHTVIVVTAFFEALQESDLPVRLSELELTKAEQLSIAHEDRGGPTGTGWYEPPVDAGHLLPEPHGDHQAVREALMGYYAALATRFEHFADRLAVWDSLSHTARERFVRATRAVPDQAYGRYTERMRQLAVDFPEVAYWTGRREVEATQRAIHALEPSLARMENLLTAVHSGRLPAEAPQRLFSANRVELSRLVVESIEVPDWLTVPTLAQAYLPPQFKVRAVTPGSTIAEEGWWEDAETRDGLDEFLAGYLTSARATEAPILVLGQPGAGKSVLTRVLAARLPAADFIAVRVPLRAVAGEADVQRQVELAISQTTGEPMSWPALLRSAPDALPVVLIDGFDELLQATGVRQTDYLFRVAEFQRREAELGRGVAVVVTTRTSVADRARTPADTLVLRLEPFDDTRIRAWVRTWNEVNADRFAHRGVRALDADAVVAHQELAAQPLLLLMLALYDADGNALDRILAGLEQRELYEQLLRAFARREVVKHRRDLTDAEIARAVEEELRRLSIVAFAMFNRRAQWVTEADLEQDLVAVFGPTPTTVSSGLRTVLPASERVLGRFFFVHKTEAVLDDTALHTYEFLHATFGEYLVARLTWQVVLDTAQRDANTTLPTASTDDELLHALLSFAALSSRGPVIEFLQSTADKLSEVERASLTALLLRLFRSSGRARPARSLDGYEPRRLSVSGRHAAYSANLLLLAVITGCTITGSALFRSDQDGPGAWQPQGVPHDPAAAWHNQALLWHSQLDEEQFSSLTYALAFDRVWINGRRDVRIALDSDRTFVAPPVDPRWAYNIDPERRSLIWNYTDADAVSRTIHFTCCSTLDVLAHAVEPLTGALGRHIYSRFYGIFADGQAVSAAHALLQTWLVVADATPEARAAAYLRYADIAAQEAQIRPPAPGHQPQDALLLIHLLSIDPYATPNLVTEILERLIYFSGQSIDAIEEEVTACIDRFLNRPDQDETSRQRLLALKNSGLLGQFRWSVEPGQDPGY